MIDVKERQRFKDWLSDMDGAIRRFTSRLPSEVGSKLDFSPESLDVLESWLLGHFSNYGELQAPSALQVYDGCARYIGQTYLKELGGFWEVRLDDPKYVYYGLPQITGFSRRPTPECPHMLATTAIARKHGGFLRSTLARVKEQEGAK